MGTITTLRPSATSSGVGWTASSGTLHSATSDDNDSTYDTWSGSGSALILATPADAPPVGERRHQARLRMRGEDGDAWGAVRLASGGLVAGVAAQFSSSPGTVTGSWGTGVPADGSTVLSCYVTGQSTGVKLEELYLDVDSREAPTFTLQVLDGTGTPSATIGDTAQPTITVGTPDLDGLSGRQYRYWVTLSGAIVWDTGVVSGPATNQATAALDNGAYVAHAQVWSTLGSNTAYASAEVTTSFTISVGSVQVPDQPAVTPVADTPFYSIEACAPLVDDFDGAEAYVEIQRVDCAQGGYLDLPGTAGSNAYASTPNPGTVPADLEVIVSAQRSDDWRPAGDETLVAHYNNDGVSQRSWRLSLDADGNGDPSLIGIPMLVWSTDGANTFFARATSRPPIDGYGRVTMRVRLDVDDGAGGYAVTFEAMDETGAWVAFSDPITNSGGGTTSLFNSTAGYYVGKYQGEFNRFTGRVYWAEVRNSADGALIVSPDFTGRMAGTTSFTDDQGNLWTVSNPASITSDQRLTSVAILGPLATDECATYVDYSLPRTGVGATCEHTPDPCCSYYRARTVGRVDGALRVSDWSDSFDTGVPAGLIVMWPSTNASVPSGWTRTTALDGKYPKQVASSSTQPGTTGGAATHTHTVPSHTHSLSHSHTTTGASGAASGTTPGNDGATGTTAILSSHTHTVPSTSTDSVSSGSATPSTSSVANDPVRLDVIWMESDGTPAGVPNNAMGLMPDISVSGWTDYANAHGRYLKGAAAGADGGVQVASAMEGHTHTVGAHTHTGTSHTHSSTSGSVTSNKSLFAGSTQALWTGSHSHSISAASTATAALGSSAAGVTSGRVGDYIPYFTIRARQNTSGVPDLPVGLICAWRGSLGSIPKHWQLCDGTNGTPSFFGKYPQGTVGTFGQTGGSLNPHSHSTSSHSDHSTSGHTHTQSLASAGAATAAINNTNIVTVALGTHTHTAPSTDSTTPTVGGSTSGTWANSTAEPPYEEVAFIQLVEEPTPPAPPEEFCLVWDDDQHLIRSENADGPLFAAVGGIFTWDVDRPFTAATGVMGGRYVTSAPPGGRNLHLSTAVESEAELAQLLTVLNRPLVLVSPSDAAEVWAAPVGSSVKIVKIGRVRQVTADFIATGPQPAPQLADVG
jgi:hypothetical protein